jgi:hypothetical protein
MKAMKGIIGAVAVSAFSTVAMAGGYIGGGGAMINYDVGGVGDTDLGLIYGVLGSQLNENFALEVRAGTGFSDGDIAVFGTEFDIELDKYVGAYLKIGAPINENFYPYAIVGYTRAELTVTGGGFSDSESDSDTSFGLGARFGSSSDMNFAVEYIRYYDKDGEELGGLSANVVWSF